MIVLDDANLDLALEGALWGAFGTTGQRCTATSRIIVQKGVYRKFVDGLVERAQKLKIGNGLDESVDMGPAVNSSSDGDGPEVHQDWQGRRREDAVWRNRLEGAAYEHGWFVAPTVFADVDPKMRIAQEEIFGPVVSIIPCDGLESAIDIANDIEYGLSSSIYTKDVNKAFTAMRDLYAGLRILTRRPLARKCICRWRDESHGQWSSRRWDRRHRFLHRVEVGLRGLFGYATAGADRPGRVAAGIRASIEGGSD